MFIKSKIQFFESKSQLYSKVLKSLIVVYQVKDTIFWKQITTYSLMRIRYNVLFIKSKIQFFESKSQLFFCKPGHDLCCLSSQRYNFLKANHNGKVFFNFAFGLFIKSKIQFFESKSQPWSSLKSGSVCCLSSQRYNFLKANHNANGVSERTDFVVYQVKDTIFWKQITT